MLVIRPDLSCPVKRIILASTAYHVWHMQHC